MTIVMPATGFDTLTYARRLRAAGVDEAQAEAHAEAVRDAVMEGVATKADLAAVKADLDNGLAAVRTELKADIAAVRTELKTDIAAAKAELKTDVANLETRLVRLIFAVAAGQAALIVGLLKLLP